MEVQMMIALMITVVLPDQIKVIVNMETMTMIWMLDRKMEMTHVNIKNYLEEKRQQRIIMILTIP